MDPRPHLLSGEFRQLRLRYAGVCVMCGAALPQGARAIYHPASKTVRCVECPTGPANATPAPIDLGTAGASPQREHDRRAEKRETAVRGRFGNRLGGIVLALTDEPQSIRAWAEGARGERALADAISRWSMLPRVPGTRRSWRISSPGTPASGLRRRGLFGLL